MAKKEANKRVFRTKMIGCRVTPEDHQRITKASNYYGMSITEYAIKCINFHTNSVLPKIRDLDKDLKKEKFNG